MKYQRTLNLSNYITSQRFAQDVIYSNIEKYEERNQSNLIKIIDDITIGKYCEFVVYEELGTSYPDVAVYSKKNKSFDADLIKDDFKIHVKACKQGLSLQPSWVFQPEDKLTTTPDKNDVIAFCLFDRGNVEFKMYKASKLLSLYRPPIKKNLKKKVIYDIDLQKV